MTGPGGKDRPRIDEGLAPGFIAAMPQLQDPNFQRTVVFLVKSSDQGAFGLVINRPGPLTVAELCEGQEIPYEGDPGARVMIGGPVEADRHLLVLHGEDPLFPGDSDDELLVAPGIRLVVARAGLERLAVRPGARYRCYLGYAGWAPGQLEAELAAGAWVPLSAHASYLFDVPPEAAWSRALREAGIDPRDLVPGGAPS